jgi:5'-deoxynucleotidase YfbR-like HD superfamily hydrolase
MYKVTTSPGLDPSPLRLLLDGMFVTRFHTVPTIHNETVAQHQGIVAGLIACIWPEAPAEIYRYAALHDVGEFATGDIPSPVKRTLSGTSRFDFNAAVESLEQSSFNQNSVQPTELSESLRRDFKLFDNLAGMVTCYHERRLGNTATAAPFENFAAYIELALGDGYPPAFAAKFNSVFTRLRNAMRHQI